jgi:hypothetical protein
MELGSSLSDVLLHAVFFHQKKHVPVHFLNQLGKAHSKTKAQTHTVISTNQCETGNPLTTSKGKMHFPGPAREKKPFSTNQRKLTRNRGKQALQAEILVMQKKNSIAPTR